MNDQSPVLDPKQAVAITCLLEQPTIRQAATAAGVSESTLYRWIREDTTFNTAYKQAQRSLWDHAMGQIQSSTAEAAKTLRDIMTDENAPETARVTASRTVLEFARQNISLQDLEERISAIEAARDEEKESPKR